jgi:putative membrane protein insertion efficiency factor
MLPRLALLPRQLLMGAVRAYRLLLKPWLGNACRFEPTCSAYALQALDRHGARRGAALSGWRILRCQPYCNGGCDPVPDTFPNPAAGLFTRLGLRTDAAKPGRPTRNLP